MLSIQLLFLGALICAVLGDNVGCTFAPVVAGIGSMSYNTSMVYNLAVGAIWTLGITLLGYFLGT